MVLSCGAAAADSTGFSWEGEIEIGVETVISSDNPGNEIRDTYLSFELGGEIELGSRVSAFAVLAGESMTPATADRSFDDMGVYIKELGLSFAVTDQVTVSLGKITPSFGRSWDEAAGFFGATLAEDYELTEQIGAVADIELASGGTVSFALFYADDTGLSRSAGFDRGRNTTAAGGAGNTGKPNNVALTWTQPFGDATSVQLGVRHLSAGTGDVSDETGVVASIAHQFNDSFALFAEVAAFDGFGGTADNASYATLNGVYTVGNWAFSGTLAHRDLDSGGKTDLASLGLDYEFDNGITAGGALAVVDDNGVTDRVLGVNVVIPLGG